MKSSPTSKFLGADQNTLLMRVRTGILFAIPDMFVSVRETRSEASAAFKQSEEQLRRKCFLPKQGSAPIVCCRKNKISSETYMRLDEYRPTAPRRD